MSKDTIIISAFPACGKTWCVENLKDKFDMSDSDSSNFSWVYNKTEDGKMEITIPQTQETFTLSDVRKGSHNAELVKLIQARIGKIIDASSGNQSAHFIRTALQEAYGKDFFALNIKGPDAAYLQGQFSKYYEKDSDGNYKWKLIEIPALDEANIIMFKDLSRMED